MLEKRKERKRWCMEGSKRSVKNGKLFVAWQALKCDACLEFFVIAFLTCSSFSWRMPLQKARTNILFDQRHSFQAVYAMICWCCNKKIRTNYKSLWLWRTVSTKLQFIFKEKLCRFWMLSYLLPCDFLNKSKFDL